MTDPSDSAPCPAIRVCGLEYRYPDGRRGVARGEPGDPGGGVGRPGRSQRGGQEHAAAASQRLASRASGGATSVTITALDLARRRPDRASVWIDGIEVNARTAQQIRRKVGLLFQDPDDQLFCTTVIEDVAFGPLNQGKSKTEARQLALECLDRVELEHEADRPPHHLSFGERKRVCLAGVLACQPSVLVLDEPTANLDPRGRRRFIHLIRITVRHQADRHSRPRAGSGDLPADDPARSRRGRRRRPQPRDPG